MHCVCDELPVFTYYRPERSLAQKLRQFVVRVAKSEWRELLICEICGIHWRIDDEDRFQERLVWKVGIYREDWSAVEFVDEQKKLLLQRRGGETEEKCAWINCEKHKVKGVAFCIDHLYATGARR